MREINQDKLAAFDYWQLHAALPKEVKQIIQQYTVWDYHTFSYTTHDNGGRPFAVSSDYSDKVIVKDNYREGTYTYTPVKVFIGRSPLTPMTEFGGGHGPKYDGNSILLYMGHNKYIFIGTNIHSFTADKIVRFVSSVGNNDVPYVFAVDVNERYYLIGENINIPTPPNTIDPYRYYYDEILPIRGRDLYCGEDKYIFRFHSDPGFNYDRMTADLGPVNMTRDEYIAIMEEHARLHDIRRVDNVVIIVKRN